MKIIEEEFDHDKSRAQLMQAYNDCEDKQAFMQAMHTIGESSRKILEVLEKAYQRKID